MIAAVLISLTCQLPEEGLALRLETGDAFYETLDVQTATRPPGQPDSPAVRSRYTLDLVTEVGPVGQSGADLRSRVESILATVSAPGMAGTNAVEAEYDSSKRIEYDAFDDEDRNQAANEAIRANWSTIKDLSVRRRVTPENVYSDGDWVGFIGEGDSPELASAVLTSLTEVISAPLPAGQLESWTDAVEWPVGDETRSVTKVLTYDGRNSDGMDRIKVSMASAKDDPAAIVGKGEVLFDRAMGRVISYDAVVQATAVTDGQPFAVTRTNIAWRLRPVPETETALP